MNPLNWRPRTRAASGSCATEHVAWQSEARPGIFGRPTQLSAANHPKPERPVARSERPGVGRSSEFRLDGEVMKPTSREACRPARQWRKQLLMRDARRG